MKTKKFTYTLEIEVPMTEHNEDWGDEYLLSALELVPQVCSTSFDGVSVTTLDIKNEAGNSLGGFPSRDAHVYTFAQPNSFNLAMIDKDRKARIEKLCKTH